MKPIAIAGVLVVVFVLLIAAVTWAILQTPPPPGPQGSAEVFLGVSPGNVDWTHVNVTFDLVQVHEATGNNSTGWHYLVVAGPTKASITTDLEQLNATTLLLLGEGSLPVGNYTAIRLHVTGEVVGTRTNGSVYHMDVNGANLTIAVPFHVNQSVATPIEAFIDLNASIVQSGLTWYFHPVATATTEGPK